MMRTPSPKVQRFLNSPSLSLRFRTVSLGMLPIFSINTYKSNGDVENVEKPNVVNVEPLMFFGDYEGVNNLYKIFSTKPPLTTYLPLVGGWSLDESDQKLSLKCICDCPSTETNE